MLQNSESRIGKVQGFRIELPDAILVLVCSSMLFGAYTIDLLRLVSFYKLRGVYEDQARSTFRSPFGRYTENSLNRNLLEYVHLRHLSRVTSVPSDPSQWMIQYIWPWTRRIQAGINSKRNVSFCFFFFNNFSLPADQSIAQRVRPIKLRPWSHPRSPI